MGRPPAELPASAARAAQLRDAGKSLAQIADPLTAEGIASPRGVRWRKGSVAHVLKRWDDAQASEAATHRP